ncbi:MAG TPA: helix-turn-helix domain-containing protein [Acidimicrobiales bacterium]|nr:helix-turn-helix domain-containing protein [Acidimicrobiales bacterium]
MIDRTDEQPGSNGHGGYAPTLVEPRSAPGEFWARGRRDHADPLAARPRRGRPPKDADAPHGPEEVVAAVVDAATVLFSTKGYGTVSLRQVAAAAGVNPGLVHRYIGSKDDVLRAVFAKFAYELEEGPNAVTTPPLRPGTERLVHTQQRIIAHLTLEGYDISKYQTQSPVVDMIMDAIRDYRPVEDREARIRTVQILALGLGWRLFESFLLSATGLGPDDAQDIQDAIRETNFTIGRGGE